MIGEIGIISRLILALILSGIIGFERETHDRPAGLRTNMLIGLGSCLFTIIALLFVQATDQSRIIANIVVGVGFLGAGAIFKSEKHPRGITTATTIWVVAAIGLTTGLGYYLYAIVGTILTFIILNLPIKKLKNHKK